jgi:hypothetical protein
VFCFFFVWLFFFFLFCFFVGVGGVGTHPSNMPEKVAKFANSILVAANTYFTSTVPSNSFVSVILHY